MSDNGNGKATLPYGPYKTVKSFVGRLKQTAIPPRIDNSVMIGLSGSAKSELRAALRYLGLVDTTDTVLPALKLLVEAHGTEVWSQELSDRVLGAYGAVIGEEAEWLDNGTAQQLRDHFKAASGMDGASLDKAIRFFLAAAEDAGLTLSPYFAVRGARPASRPSGARRASPKRKPSQEAVDVKERASNNGALEPGLIRLPFTVPNKPPISIIIPESLTAKEWQLVHAYVTGVLGLGGETEP